MGFLDDAQSALGRGMSAARGAVSGVALESIGFVRRFVRMCDDGWNQGWHERNGGNASYRLTEQDISSARPFFAESPSAWQSLGVNAPSLANAFFLVTAAGSFMRNIALDPDCAVGIVEIGPVGDAYRIVWGLRDSGRPTSEFAGHVLMHEARVLSGNDDSRVIYHAHPVPVIAMTKVVPLDNRTLTRVLWKAMTECVMVFPEGVGVVGPKVPGSLDLARASAEQMRTHAAVVWAHHGLLCAGTNFDDAFGRMHAIVKAAEIYTTARMMSGGDADFANDVGDDVLRGIAESLGLSLNEDYLA